jgi:hypothetical protein
MSEASKSKVDGSRGAGIPWLTAATVLREVPSGKLVTRAEVAVAPQADDPSQDSSAKASKTGDIMFTVRIPSSSIARRKRSLGARITAVTRTIGSVKEFVEGDAGDQHARCLFCVDIREEACV